MGEPPQNKKAISPQITRGFYSILIAPKSNIGRLPTSDNGKLQFFSSIIAAPLWFHQQFYFNHPERQLYCILNKL